jgi:glycerol kinase
MAAKARHIRAIEWNTRQGQIQAAMDTGTQVVPTAEVVAGPNCRKPAGATNQWDAELLQALDIPASLLPTVKPSSALYGEVAPDLLGHAIPIGGVAGDQQSALFGQACFKAGMVKNTYGTGCFMLMHTGGNFQTSHNGLITTSAAQTAPTPEFAIEGSVFVGGAVVQWLRDGLHAVLCP